MADDKNFIGTPWWTTVSGAGTADAAMASWADDYTKSRSGLQYDSVDDIIGRADYTKYRLTTTDVATVSGTDGTILV